VKLAYYLLARDRIGTLLFSNAAVCSVRSLALLVFALSHECLLKYKFLSIQENGRCEINRLYRMFRSF
jgi:hypothetical protein